MTQPNLPQTTAGATRRTPSMARVAGYVAVSLGVVLGFYVLYLIRAVLFLFLVAVLLATAIEPLVFRLRRGPFSRGQGILLVYTGIMLVIFAIAAVVVPVFLREAGGFSETYPQLLQNARDAVYGLDQRVLGPAAEKVVEKASSPSAVAGADGGETAITVGLTVVEGLFAAVTVFVVAYYWLTERIEIKRAFTTLFPREHRHRVGLIWGEVETALGGWVRGQLLLMLFIGVLATAGYIVMGLKYALVLGLLAGLFEIVPLVGPWLGAVPALMVAVMQDFKLAVIVGVYLLIIQNVEANVLVPRVMQRTVGVSSLVVLLGILIGATLGGIAGALVAVPLAAAIQVVLRNLVAGDPEASPDDAEARERLVESTGRDITELPLPRSA
jgi:predicted PurR-regulated permease PerM